MIKKIKIKFPSYSFNIDCCLNNTNIAQNIYNKLPQESRVRTWGEEIYFELPFKFENEKPTLNVDIGDVGWWPEGNCFCIFFGKTPNSLDDKPKPYSEVTIIGKIVIDEEIIKKLKLVKSNSKVRLEKYE